MIARDSERLDISIRDEASLTAASDAMHDAIFDQSDIVIDEGRGVFRLTVWREVPELAKRERVLLLLHRVRMPRVRSVLEFEGVRRAVVQKQDHNVSGDYCLNEILYDPGERRMELRVTGPLAIALEVDRLVGSLTDLGDPTWDAPSIPTLGIGP